MKLNRLFAALAFVLIFALCIPFCGMLSVEGQNLHIQVLNTEAGVVTLDGAVDALSYYQTDNSEKSGNTGFFGRLFR